MRVLVKLFLVGALSLVTKIWKKTGRLESQKENRDDAANYIVENTKKSPGD